MSGDRVDGRVRVLAELVRTMTIESQRLGQVFAGGQQMHATDMEALVHVMEAHRRGTPLSPGELAGRLGLTSSATTSVIDRLESQRHVYRERDLGDRRRVHLLVDGAAEALAGAFFGPLAGRTATALEPFGDDELDAAARVMTALTAAMRGYREDLARNPPS